MQVTILLHHFPIILHILLFNYSHFLSCCQLLGFNAVKQIVILPFLERSSKILHLVNLLYLSLEICQILAIELQLVLEGGKGFVNNSIAPVGYLESGGGVVGFREGQVGGVLGIEMADSLSEWQFHYVVEYWMEEWIS